MSQQQQPSDESTKFENVEYLINQLADLIDKKDVDKITDIQRSLYVLNFQWKNKNSLTLYYTMIIRLKYENNWYLVQCAMTRIEHFGKKWNNELSRPWTTTKKTR